MNIKKFKKTTALFSGFMVTAASSAGLFLSATQSAIAGGRFVCAINSQGTPYTALTTSRGNLAIIYWDKWAPGPWTSKKRCTEVRDRFNSYSSYDMKGVQAGTKNGYPVLCTTGCQKVVFTLELGTNAREYVQRFKNRIELGAGPELHLSSNNPFYSNERGETIINMNALMTPVTINALGANIFEIDVTNSQTTPPQQVPPVSAPVSQPDDDGIIPYDPNTPIIDSLPEGENPWQ